MRRIVALLTAVLASMALLTPAHPAGAVAAKPAHTVTYDKYSMMIDGHRTLIEAAEFHYFRLPSPSLWRDILEKYKAGGFNAVSVYFDWAYHSPKPGVYDFTGVRDVDRFLRTAEEVGLYVIARPGPYINAETTGGGFPAWLKTTPGTPRTSSPAYTAAYQDWIRHVDKYIAPHQITRGGSVIAYQVENEYATNTDRQYMADLEAKVKSDGINVPITHNQCCDAASWTTDWTTGQGAVDIEGVDGYPQSFECESPDTTWGPWGEGVTERTSKDTPVFAAEYQAGSIDEYNTGYQGCRDLTGPAYMKYFYKNNLVNSGATMFSYYMGFGGTSWGLLPQPNDVYTSYDYGAAITEARQLTTKFDEFKRQNYFLQAVAPLTKTDAATAPTSSNSALGPVARANPDTGTQFVLVRHTDRNATTNDSTTLSWATPDGAYSVPVSLNGHDAKVLVAGYDLGGQRLVYSTSEILTHAYIGGKDVAVLYGRDGEAGQTVLRYSSRPAVRVLSGAVTSSYSANGDLRLDYSHKGLARVLITGGGRRPLLLLLGTDAEAARFWTASSSAGPVLLYGTSTSLLRSATSHGAGLDLRVDTAATTGLEVFANARFLSVDGTPLRTSVSAGGSLLATAPGPQAAKLPALTGWKTHSEAPEAQTAFDDSRWTTADKTTSSMPYTPKTQPVLFAEDYGYLYGDVWYRGHFTATGQETTVSLNAITGKRGIYLAWLNGHYLGTAAGGTQADTDTKNPDPGPGSFTVPAGLLKAGEPAVLSVLVENMGHNDDWTVDDNRFKQPRGLFGASIDGVSSISWKIQGDDPSADPVRGPLNVGGLYGERNGWYLPGFPDRSWSSGTPGSVAPGINWYRTGFDLRLAKGQDTSVGLRFAGAIPSDTRVFIYLNGWNLGQYGSLGPQTDFVLPAGLLRQDGHNTLALAVISAKSTAVAVPSLVDLGTVRGGVPVANVYSPDFAEARS